MGQTITKTTRWALISAGLLTFLGILNETSMNVAYEIISHQFNISLDLVQWITTGYLLTVTIIMGATAYLLRTFPARWLHLTAGLMFLTGAVLSALAPNFTWLLVGRILQGVSTGLATPIMFHLIFTQVPKQYLGATTGMAGMIISLAPALGPLFGGAIAHQLTWRWIFWLIMPLIIIALIGGQLFIRNQLKANANLSFNFGALIALGGALTSFILSANQLGATKSHYHFYFWGLGGILMLIIFIAINLFSKSPLINFKIFRFPTIRTAAVTYFGLQFMNIGLSVVLPTYAVYVMRTNSFVAGLILLPGSLVGAFTSPFAGILADRYGAKWPVSIGAAIFLIATWAMMAFQRPLLTPWGLALSFACFRFGFNLAFSNTISYAAATADHALTPDVNSCFNMLQQFAGAVSVTLATALISYQQHFAKLGHLPYRTYLGSRHAFIMMFLIALVVVSMIYLTYHVNRPNKK